MAPRADAFLAARAHRTANIRTQLVNGDILSEPHALSLAADLPSNEELLQTRYSPHQARMWSGEDFVPAHLQSALPFWRDVILSDTPEPERGTLLRWVEGVSVYDFVDPTAHGEFQGRSYRGADLTAVHLPNHVPHEFSSWVTGEIAALVQTGCVARWEDIADTELHPKPHLVLPLGVEPTKPRLLWDARWLNLMCKHSPFSMDGVGKVAQCAWRGAHMVTIDHKSGYHHVGLHPDSWQHFGFEWEGHFYVFTVLCFGWCSAPVIYASLSEALARYLRSRGVPVLTWIDDFFLTNFRSTKSLPPVEQFHAAQAAAYLVLEVSHRAGYFISIPKCQLKPTTCLVYLGIVCDSGACRFEVPEDKLNKLEKILVGALSSGVITFKLLEKLAGKCTSLSVAVPVAALYTHHMYKQIAIFQRTGGKKRNMDIEIPQNSGLRLEMLKWLEVRKQFNGASWYRAEHKLVSLTGASDASSTGWGGVVRSPADPVFRAGGDFPPDIASRHINVQEGYALKQTLHLFCTDRPARVAGSTLVVDVDNKVLHDAAKRGRSRNTMLHEMITDFFWLQVRRDFTLKLRWVPSAANAEADGISRAGSDENVRLSTAAFTELWEWAGGFDMDLMATPVSVQKVPAKGHTAPIALPFYSRYRTQGCAGVDVLTQNVAYLPSSREPCFGFCFPPTSMVGVILQHLEECKARAVVVVPDQKQSWFPRLASAMVRCRKVSNPGKKSPFFRVHHQRGKETFEFRQWAMKAVEVDFSV